MATNQYGYPAQTSMARKVGSGRTINHTTRPGQSNLQATVESGVGSRNPVDRAGRHPRANTV